MIIAGNVKQMTLLSFRVIQKVKVLITEAIY